MDRVTILRAFVRLVELETFSATAADLRVSQSTVSKWIASLETEVGARLVDRTTRSLHVTDAGQRFYRRASAILADYEGAVDEVRDVSDTLRGRIRVSVPVVFGQRFVVPLVADFLTRHEQIEIELIFSDRYLNLVDEGLDLCIRVGTPVESSLNSHLLGNGERRLVASPLYLERHGVPKKPRDLERHQCLLHTEGSMRAAWSFRRGNRTQHVRVGGRVATNNSESTLHMARAGLGIALLASWLVDAELRNGALVAVLEDYQPPAAPICALTPPGRFVAPRVRALMEALRSVMPPASGRRR